MKRIVRTIVSALLFTIPGYITANPTGGSFAPNAGSGSIVLDPGTNTVTITQKTDKGVVNWDSFSNQSHETIRFNQPGPSSITLNNVIGADPSVIQGRLEANGNVWIVNPNGIQFGPTARVDVAGLLATTAIINKDDFMNGHYRFVQDPNQNNAVLVQQGAEIRVQDTGIVALVAPGVSNRGLIVANLGKVYLGSGLEYTVDLYGDNLIHFAVAKENINQGSNTANERPVTPEGEILNDAVHNGGHIIAHGGHVVLSTDNAKRVVENVINMEGIIEAKTAKVLGEEKTGEIILFGSGRGKVKVNGELHASGLNKGQRGGKIKVLGEEIETGEEIGKIGIKRKSVIMKTIDKTEIKILDKTLIDVSGDIKAGEALIGGDYLGQNPNIRNSTKTSIGRDTLIKADTLTKGDGGRVIVWADKTKFYGQISSKSLGGEASFVETSGAHGIDFYNSPGLLPLGQRISMSPGGHWLMDPSDVIVNNGPTNNGTFVLNGTTETWTPTAALSHIMNTDINTFLDAGLNVTIKTFDPLNGDIAIGAPITTTAGAGNTLTLQAGSVGGNVIFFSGVTSTNQLFINAFGGGGINVLGGALSIVGGAITFNTAGTISVTAGISTGGGDLNFTSGGSTTISASISTSNGACVMSANGLTWDPGFPLDTGSAPLQLNANAGLLTLNSNLSGANVSFSGTGYSQGSGVTVASPTDGINISSGSQTLSLGSVTVQGTFISLTGTGISINGTTITFSGVLLPTLIMDAGSGALSLNTTLPAIPTMSGLNAININAGQPSTITTPTLIATINAPQLTLTANNCNLLGTIGGFTTEQVSARSPVFLANIPDGATGPLNTYFFGGQDMIFVSPSPAPSSSGGLSGAIVTQGLQGLISALAAVTAGLGGGGGANQQTVLGFGSTSGTGAEGGTVTTEQATTTTTSTGGEAATTPSTTTTTTTTSTTTTTTTTSSTTTSTTTTSTTNTTSTDTTATSSTTTASTTTAASQSTATTTTAGTQGTTPTTAAAGAAGAPNAPGVPPGTAAPASPTPPGAPLTPSQTANLAPAALGRDVPGPTAKNIESVPNNNLSPFEASRPEGTYAPGGLEAQNTSVIGAAVPSAPQGYADNINRTPVSNNPLTYSDLNNLLGAAANADVKNIAVPIVSAPAATTPEIWVNVPSAGSAAPPLRQYSQVEGFNSGMQPTTVMSDYSLEAAARAQHLVPEVFFPAIKAGGKPLTPTETAILDSFVNARQ